MRAVDKRKMATLAFRGMVSALAVAAVTGCSSVPDSLDPSTWVSGVNDWVSNVFDSTPDTEAQQTAPPTPAEKPQLGNDERPKGEPTAERQQIAEGLVADRANAQYTESELKRMGDPTRPLDEAHAAPASEATASIQTGAPDAAPSPSPAAAPSPSPAAAPSPSSKPLTSSVATPQQTPPPAASDDTESVVAPSARVNMNEDQGTPATPRPAPVQTASAAPPPAPAPKPAPTPAAAPVAAPAAAPAPAPVPAAAPAPRPSVAAGNGDLVGATYRERLAEFASGEAAASAPRAAPAPAGSESTVMNDSSTLPNSKVTATKGSGGAHPLSALDQAKMAASFEVAEIAFDEGTSVLLPAEQASLRQVVEVYRASKGTAKIGIIGHSNSPRLDVSAVANRESNRSLAAQRADAVARALEKMGVPAGKIYAGATGETAGDYAEVFAAY